MFARLIGVIEAEQTQQGQTKRNDRLIAVAAQSHDHRNIVEIKQVSANLLDEIAHFFVSYVAMEGKQFKPLGRFGPDRAQKLVEDGIQLFEKKQGRSKT